MSIRYLSTRGTAPILGFEDAVLAGLASDGGLYVPEALPQFSPAEIAGFAGLSYPDLAMRVLAPFVEGTLKPDELKRIVEAAYEPFRHAAIAPLVQLERGHFVLELFHGPTLAFKDFALQFLGQLLDHLLQKRKEKIIIAGATSGDTGSAAIAGCGGRRNIDIFILHPHERVSEVQRRQMTTVTARGVHNFAVQGSFDDCQDIVKDLFMRWSALGLGKQRRLVAVNSINWARIMAQIVYYFYAAAALGSPGRPVSFSVPTGNFGDIYAGYLAKRMGLPVERLIIASNRNDILTRCLQCGSYAMEGVTPSLSPSMDIQVSSNFERLLFDLHDRNGAQIATLMQQFRESGSITLSPTVMARLKREFDAHAVDDEATLATIAAAYEQSAYLADPHTAVGIAAARALPGQAHIPVVTLATAHPAKFPDAVRQASGKTPELPAHLKGLLRRKERYTVVENNTNKILNLILTSGTK